MKIRSSQASLTDDKPYSPWTTRAMFIPMGVSLSVSTWSLAHAMIPAGMPTWMAWAVSAGLDGAAIAAAKSAQDDAERGYSSLFSRLLVYSFTSLSSLANYLHAKGAVWSWPVLLTVTAFPIVAALVFELILQRTTRTARAKKEPRRRTGQGARIDLRIRIYHPIRVMRFRSQEALTQLDDVTLKGQRLEGPVALVMGSGPGAIEQGPLALKSSPVPPGASGPDLAQVVHAARSGDSRATVATDNGPRAKISGPASDLGVPTGPDLVTLESDPAGATGPDLVTLESDPKIDAAPVTLESDPSGPLASPPGSDPGVSDPTKNDVALRRATINEDILTLVALMDDLGYEKVTLPLVCETLALPSGSSTGKRRLREARAAWNDQEAV